MKITGQLRFERRCDGTITRTWTGGRRVGITTGLLEALGAQRPYAGRVISLSGLDMRIIDMAYAEPGRYQDLFVIMREGPLARFMFRYWRWLNRNAASLFTWECKWFRWRKPQEGENYPKWSIVGILIRPVNVK